MQQTHSTYRAAIDAASATIRAIAACQEAGAPAVPKLYLPLFVALDAQAVALQNLESQADAGAERLSYDSEALTLHDEGGNLVAAEVRLCDAPLFLFADRLMTAADKMSAILAYTSTGVAGDEAAQELQFVLDSIKAYQDKARRQEAAEIAAAPQLRTVIREALAYGADQFDGQGDDVDVEGADMVAWFAEWRQAARLALAAEPDTSAYLPQAAAELADAMEEALTTHIYDEQNGDEIPEDSGYVLAIKAVRDCLTAQARPPASRVFVSVSAGCIKGVTINGPADVVVTVADYDTEGETDPDKVMMVLQDDGKTWAPAYVSVYGDMDLALSDDRDHRDCGPLEMEDEPTMRHAHLIDGEFFPEAGEDTMIAWEAARRDEINRDIRPLSHNTVAKIGEGVTHVFGGQLPAGMAAAGLGEAMGGPLAQEGVAEDRAGAQPPYDEFEASMQAAGEAYCHGCNLANDGEHTDDCPEVGPTSAEVEEVLQANVGARLDEFEDAAMDAAADGGE